MQGQRCSDWNVSILKRSQDVNCKHRAKLPSVPYFVGGRFSPNRGLIGRCHVPVWRSHRMYFLLHFVYID